MKAMKLILAAILALGVGFPVPAIAEATKVRVSAHAAIRQGDLAGAQSEALDEALLKALEEVLAGVVPERTFAALEPLLEARIFPQAQNFITNYQIVNRDVSDLAYTVHVSVTVDTDLLRKKLASIGVIKEPGSPPLAAVFVTVDAPLGLDHVKSLGALADRTVSADLDRSNLVVIPPPDDDDMGFRVVRPPQAPEALVSGGLVALADLAVGVLFKRNGEAVVTGSTMSIPMYLSIQAVDVATGTLVDVGLTELDVMMGTRDGSLLSDDPGKSLTVAAARLTSILKERYLAGETKSGTVPVIFEGAHDAGTVRLVLSELQFRLGEGSSILPESFSANRSRYSVWTTRDRNEVVGILKTLEKEGSPFKVANGEDTVVLGMGVEKPPAGVLEFGEEVTFYRRLPMPGIENPDDIRKIEFVAWQEMEANHKVSTANLAPFGMGILGRIDPSRDLDMFRFTLPEGVDEISVSVEQSGPGEVRPRVRVFTATGDLLAEQVAGSRGRNLYFTVPVSNKPMELVISVEDFLGRYPSMFPYVLKVSITKDRGADGDVNSPSINSRRLGGSRGLAARDVNLEESLGTLSELMA
ncbi:MAG: hypothetical protein P1S46_07875 [bacterium]|nr:hypothetical protein [bacterium]MDT8395668.1 hypothetical protein [bacterium]